MKQEKIRIQKIRLKSITGPHKQISHFFSQNFEVIRLLKTTHPI